MKQYIRKLEIMEILSSHQRHTMSELAATFGVSVRTIKRDIDDLVLSYPINIDKGINGGVKLRDDYQYTKRYLNKDQTELLKDLGKYVEADKIKTYISIFFDFTIDKDVSWINT